jgi:hypothetical protein
VGEQLVGAVQRSVGRRILGVVFGLAVPPDVFMCVFVCVVTGRREDVLPCVHARHPAGRHADGQIETRGPQHCAPPSPRTMGTAAGVDGAFAVAWTVTRKVVVYTTNPDHLHSEGPGRTWTIWSSECRYYTRLFTELEIGLVHADFLVCFECIEDAGCRDDQPSPTPPRFFFQIKDLDWAVRGM